MKRLAIMTAAIVSSFSAFSASYNEDLAAKLSSMTEYQLEKLSNDYNVEMADYYPVTDGAMTIVTEYMNSHTKQINVLYRLDLKSQGLDANVMRIKLSESKGRFQRKRCESTKTRTFFEGGFSLVEIYYDSNSNYITSLSFNKKGCK